MATLALALAFSQPVAAATAVRILTLGDSLTAGYGLIEADSFPAQLQAALTERGFNVDVLNGGVSGDTTSAGRARLEWALSDQPDVVIVELGANDGLRGIDPELTRDNLAAILEALRAKDVRVLLTGMYAPPNLGSDYSERFNAIYPDLADRYGVMLYPFFLDGVATEPALNQSDGIHPNRDGVAVIVERILPLVMRLIEQLPSVPPN
ncbi:MAG: arylesterase [Gammaproteobacteria bacterium]|nr:arylesterase [Gammaproteobacteria bacterium]